MGGRRYFLMALALVMICSCEESEGEIKQVIDSGACKQRTVTSLRKTSVGIIQASEVMCVFSETAVSKYAQEMPGCEAKTFDSYLGFNNGHHWAPRQERERCVVINGTK
jgi:hypothetical protein